jgi:hypothetical protein
MRSFIIYTHLPNIFNENRSAQIPAQIDIYIATMPTSSTWKDDIGLY